MSSMMHPNLPTLRRANAHIAGGAHPHRAREKTGHKRKDARGIKATLKMHYAALGLAQAHPNEESGANLGTLEGFRNSVEHRTCPKPGRSATDMHDATSLSTVFCHSSYKIRAYARSPNKS